MRSNISETRSNISERRASISETGADIARRAPTILRRASTLARRAQTFAECPATFVGRAGLFAKAITTVRIHTTTRDGGIHDAAKARIGGEKAISWPTKGGQKRRLAC
jgi:hypothetical protein